MKLVLICLGEGAPGVAEQEPIGHGLELADPGWRGEILPNGAYDEKSVNSI